MNQPNLSALIWSIADLLRGDFKAYEYGYLDQQTSRLDCLISGAERSISLLQERRSALITAAMTGKIDVRGLVEA
ncbi:hypothetical protein [Candidatus Igneacidithiobacillus taiwanensis]|uniref:hypothetical protein n=1 Tax=Candidatus Igneacidithiobacillus taiwanensis TaxID=1945924 RepID=UPI00289E76BD|nr:hypothetical protein [Candidatus Igneacidithiobacillus taiwanensis]